MKVNETMPVRKKVNTNFVNMSVTCYFSSADINECATGAHQCLPGIATCEDTQPGYGCVCKQGYHGDGRIGGNGCQDDNECRCLCYATAVTIVTINMC